jgi:hypothetical protein
MLDKIYYIEQMVQPYRLNRHFDNQEVLWKKLEALIESESNAVSGSVQNTESVIIPVLDASDIEEYQETISKFERKIEEFDEELLTLNASTKIEIPDTDIEILQKVKII